jgi:hypothetical protein
MARPTKVRFLGQIHEIPEGSEVEIDIEDGCITRRITLNSQIDETIIDSDGDERDDGSTDYDDLNGYCSYAYEDEDEDEDDDGINE